MRSLRGAALLRYRLGCKPRHGRRLPSMLAAPFLPYVPGAMDLHSWLTRQGYSLLRCVHPYHRRSGDVTIQLIWSRRGELDLVDTHTTAGVVPPIVVLSLVEG